MLIENNTVYTGAVIDEGCSVLTRKIKIFIAVSSVLMLILAGVFILMGSATIFTIGVYGFGIFVIAAVGFSKISVYKKTLKQRFMILNGVDKAECHYLIDDEKITARSAKGSNSLYHKDIKTFSETKNLYVIIYAGNLFLMISRNGFAEGKEEEFRKALGK